MTHNCALCSHEISDWLANYPRAVCDSCDLRAVNASGEPPACDPGFDMGENPVFIGRHRCWRRYRLGGWVTMFDPWESADIMEFYDTSEFFGRPEDQAGAFVRLLVDPPAAVVAGLYTDELTHNRALHSIIGSRCGATFVRALATHALGPSLVGQVSSTLRALLSEVTWRVSATYQPRMKDRRGDEVVQVAAGDQNVDLVIEMKVEAGEDLGQLREYVATHRQKHPGRAVLGILLAIGRRDVVVHDDLVVIGAAQLGMALADSVFADTPSRLRHFINDYRRSVAYLELRDTLVLECVGAAALHEAAARVGEAQGVLLGHSSVDVPAMHAAVARWEKLEWRWEQRRIAREVQRSLSRTLPPFAWRVSTNDDATGTAVDLWLRADVLNLTPGTQLFVKWRVGSGFAVHADARKLGKAGPSELRAIRKRFRPALRAGLGRHGQPVESNKPGKTGAILAIADSRMEWAHIAARICDLSKQALDAMAAAAVGVDIAEVGTLPLGGAE